MTPTRPAAGETWRVEALVFLLLVTIALIIEYTGIDYRIIDPLWDPEPGRWLLTDKWWANEFLHDDRTRSPPPEPA